MPLPYLQETVRRVSVYSVGELEVIANVLRQHEHEYSNLTRTGSGAVVVQTLFQYVHAYRAHNI